MIRANLVAPKQFVIEEVPIPEPAANEVLIRVKNCGICGSDVHAYHGRHPFISCPIVLGHEFSGVIEGLGPGAEAYGLSRGQRVTVEPNLVCGKCYNCRIGRYNICDELKVIGCQSTGAYAEYLIVPAAKVVPLADSVSFEHGAMIEPLAVGVRAYRRAGVGPGDRILIIGAGTIGLMTLMAAKAQGAQVMISDLVPFRLDVAKKLGADAVVNSGEENLAEAIRRFAPYGMDAIIECVGAAATIRQAVELARKGSRIVIVGVASGDVPVPMSLVQDRELEIVGDLMYTREEFDLAQRLVVEGKTNFPLVLSKTFALTEVAEAFRYIQANEKTTLKVMLNIG